MVTSLRYTIAKWRCMVYMWWLEVISQCWRRTPGVHNAQCWWIFVESAFTTSQWCIEHSSAIIACAAFNVRDRAMAPMGTLPMLLHRCTHYEWLLYTIFSLLSYERNAINNLYLKYMHLEYCLSFVLCVMFIGYWSKTHHMRLHGSNTYFTQ